MSRNVLRRASLVICLLVMILVACAPDELPTAPGFQSPGTPVTGSPVSGRLRAEGYPTTGEIRQGWVLGRDGRPMAVTYEVHDGDAVWQGDIVLGRASEISTTAAGAKPFMRMGSGVAARVGGTAQPGVAIDGDGPRWPGGVMPYLYDPALPEQNRIQEAITMIESSTGGIVIRPMKSGDTDWIKIVPDDGCSSPVGRKGGEQLIKLASDCNSGSLAHEMLHALGQFHEHGRCDRDTYVEIQFDNVEDGKASQFDKHCDDATDYGPYEFGSLMHYSLISFSRNGQPTIKLRPGVTYDGTIGQRTGLAGMDKFVMNNLYGLNNIPPVATICTLGSNYREGTNAFLDGRCTTDVDDKVLTYEWNFDDESCFAIPKPANCTQPNPIKVYANDGVYKLGLFAFDGYAVDATEQFITIQNVAPDFTMPPVSPIIEGGAISRNISYTDPGADLWTGSVNFGDGTPVDALDTSGKFVIFGHTYVDNNPPGAPFQLSLSIRDDDVTTTKTTDVVVDNVKPGVSAGSDVVLESGQSFHLSASFSDPGLRDAPWTWSVNWGAGSPSTGSLNTQARIEVSRQMCASGTYNVVVSVTDKDGGTGTDQVAVTVGFVAAGTDILPGGTPNAVSLKKRGSLPVAILSSATFDAATIDVASVRLGDDTGTETPAEKQKGRFVTRAEDVNGDGRLDLVVSFNVQDLMTNGDLTASTTALVIRGFQGAAGGSCVNFRGTDAVVVVS